MFSRTLHQSSTRIAQFHQVSLLRRKATVRMASSMRPQRRFAPLGKPGTEGAPQLQGIVFDMDGTLCMYSFLL